MSSPKPEIDDILSSIRKMIDDRGPPAEAPKPVLVLSADNLVSLPPVRPDQPAEAAPETEEQETSATAAEVPPEAEAPVEGPFFGAGRSDWIHRPRAEPSDLTDSTIAPAPAKGWPEDVLLPESDSDEDESDEDETADAVAGDTEDTATPDSREEEGLSRIAAAAQRAVERLNADRRAAEQLEAETPEHQPHAATSQDVGQDTRQDAPSLMPDPFADNLFAMVTQPHLPQVTPAGQQDGSDDDALAEHLADVVREQIAETLPLQIKALAPHLLDEDVLRPVVADLIRKELAGAFGARITQGVRKLVRQEVNRAISLRRLE